MCALKLPKPIKIEDRPSRFLYNRAEIKRSRETELAMKACAVKAAREHAAARKLAAQETRMTVVRSKVAAVKAMKAIVPSRQARKPRIKHTRVISRMRSSPIETVNTAKVSQHIMLPELGHEPVCEVNSQTHKVNAQTTEPLPVIPIMPSVALDELKAARIREMKELQAAKARLAIASLAVEETAKVSAAVMTAENDMAVLTSVININTLKTRRAAKVAAAVTEFRERDQVIVTTMATEIKTLQAKVDGSIEQFNDVGMLVKRVKAAKARGVESAEMMETEIDVGVIIGSSRRLYPQIMCIIFTSTRRHGFTRRRGWKRLLREGIRVHAFFRGLADRYSLVCVSDTKTGRVPELRFT